MALRDVAGRHPLLERRETKNCPERATNVLEQADRAAA
jgi:hypothetical protein